MIDEFLKIFTSRMQPPRRYETLRRFLQRTGARSLPEALRTCPTDKRALAMVDDRCDPSMGAEGTGKLRQWESEEYRRFPPSGLNVQVYGANAEMLYKQLQKDVCMSSL